MEKASRNRMNDVLLGKMWKTKSSRFNADLRLRRKHALSLSATTILAFYIFAVSLLPLTYTPSSSGGAEKLISIITLLISVFLIIIILLESTKNYQKEADRMLRCALEISDIYNRFQALTPEAADQKRVAFNDEYGAALQKHELNHKDIDYLQFQLRSASELGIGWGRYATDCGKYLYFWLGEYWLYIALIIAPPLAAFVYQKHLGF